MNICEVCEEELESCVCMPGVEGTLRSGVPGYQPAASYLEGPYGYMWDEHQDDPADEGYFRD